jgi:hypothetical protein
MDTNFSCIRIVDLPTCLPTYLTICLSVCLSAHLSTHLYIRLSVRPSVCPFFCLFICLFVLLSVRPFFSLSASPTVRLSNSLSVSMSVHMLYISVPARQSLRLCLAIHCQSLYRYLCISICSILKCICLLKLLSV